MPLADLFEWGTDGSAASKLISAMYVGDESINGAVCSHYAYREKDFDWQLRIAKSDGMLPCKLSIVDKQDPAHPHYTAVYSWQAAPDVSANRFEFTPPANVHLIEIRRVDAAQNT